MKNIEARVDDPRLAGARLDVFIAEGIGLFSRSQAKTRIVEARVNGKASRLSRRLKPGDTVSVDFIDAQQMNADPQDIPLDILFENDDVIVLNKPYGMVVHPGSGNPTGTLVNALLFHCRGLGEAFGFDKLRPGIVHRLDKDTSGVIIAAKHPRAHELLAAQFTSHEARKRYLAIVLGSPKELQGRIETKIRRDPSHRKKFICSQAQGRTAITRFKVLRMYPAGRGVYAFVSLRPHTGRTHQLRVHMRHLACPILGDPLYGREDTLFPGIPLMLHAQSLIIRLPGEESPRGFAAPLPPRFRETLRTLQSLSPR
jgi:23S rRNA pseudouridine1911/1915/1917 synthase